MEVFEFDKTLLDRLNESMNVLTWKDEVIPASQVRNEWSYCIEIHIEPTGWQALWKIPRVICEELGIRFPTVVFGTIEEVLFRELKAVFLVNAVQDDRIQLPERHEVALEDLWPTLNQENSELNVERTADYIDRLRFFYTNVWMPWDNDSDDDLNWVEKHLKSRIEFCYDLRKGNIKRAVVAHIRTLLTEARYIQQRREYLELDLGDEDDQEDTEMSIEDGEKLEKSHITDLMRLHLRLATIRSEIEMLENKEMRRIYEQIQFDDEKSVKNSINAKNSKQRVSYIIAMSATLASQISLMQLAKQYIPKDHLVQVNPSLQNVLSRCQPSDSIYLSAGRHNIKFLEYLNDNGCIVGLSATDRITTPGDDQMTSQDVVIASSDDESILLVFDGDFTLENLTLDCKNVRIGILIKKGRVCLRNCHLIGDSKSSTQAIACASNARLLMEHCSIQNFTTGLIVHTGTHVELQNVNINSCKIGVDLSGNAKSISFDKVHINGSEKCGIYVDGMPLQHTNMKSLTIRNFTDLKKYTDTSAPWHGVCKFEQCKENIYILNKLNPLVASNTLNKLLDNEQGNGSVEMSSCIIHHVSH